MVACNRQLGYNNHVKKILVWLPGMWQPKDDSFAGRYRTGKLPGILQTLQE